MARDPKDPPKNIPTLVLIYELARYHQKLPWELKQLPWAELKEMLKMMELRRSLLGS